MQAFLLGHLWLDLRARDIHSTDWQASHEEATKAIPPKPPCPRPSFISDLPDRSGLGCLSTTSLNVKGPRWPFHCLPLDQGAACCRPFWRVFVSGIYKTGCPIDGFAEMDLHFSPSQMVGCAHPKWVALPSECGMAASALSDIRCFK